MAHQSLQVPISYRRFKGYNALYGPENQVRMLTKLHDRLRKMNARERKPFQDAISEAHEGICAHPDNRAELMEYRRRASEAMGKMDEKYQGLCTSVSSLRELVQTLNRAVIMLPKERERTAAFLIAKSDGFAKQPMPDGVLFPELILHLSILLSHVPEEPASARPMVFETIMEKLNSGISRLDFFEWSDEILTGLPPIPIDAGPAKENPETGTRAQKPEKESPESGEQEQKGARPNPDAMPLIERFHSAALSANMLENELLDIQKAVAIRRKWYPSLSVLDAEIGANIKRAVKIAKRFEERDSGIGPSAALDFAADVYFVVAAHEISKKSMPPQGAAFMEEIFTLRQRLIRNHENAAKYLLERFTPGFVDFILLVHRTALHSINSGRNRG